MQVTAEIIQIVPENKLLMKYRRRAIVPAQPQIKMSLACG